MQQHRWHPYARLMIAGLLSGILYVFLLGTIRSDSFRLMGLFAGAFGLYLWQVREVSRLEGLGLRTLGAIGILALLCRLLVVLPLPNLSDDYFRFAWDGRLWCHGVNPFLEVPRTLMQDPEAAARLGLTPALFAGLNSPDYFTIYPPVLQGLFAGAAWLAPDSLPVFVWILKGIIVMAEGLNLYLIYRILRQLELPLAGLALYALNPLVIVELTGNLHFEALMITGILLLIWCLLRGQIAAAGAGLALGILTKLLPLMFMPLLLRRLGWGRTIWLGIVAGGVTLLGFLAILRPETLAHLSQSIDLYFRKFEFNASFYYLVRWVGYLVKGYNIIQKAGPWLAFTTVCLILLYMLLERKPGVRTLPAALMWCLLIYFSMASIVHPWYITTLVALCGMTTYRFPVLWSVLLPLTYLTYQTTAYTENLWITGGCYILLWGAIMAEWRWPGIGQRLIRV
ncbi:MAG: glycosyltransferase 87 family protein [Bacteroidia bacterium]|nr:glycosyltransferase 87 family protein [Bacteroidia bacterium]